MKAQQDRDQVRFEQQEFANSSEEEPQVEYSIKDFSHELITDLQGEVDEKKMDEHLREILTNENYENQTALGFNTWNEFTYPHSSLKEN